MSELILTQERLKELLCYSAVSGLFIWVKSPNQCIKIGDSAGSYRTSRNKKYHLVKIDGRLHMSHRLAWLYVYGSFPENEIDHIDGDGCNNKLSNLRCVTHEENSKNIKIRNDNTSGTSGNVVGCHHKTTDRTKPLGCIPTPEIKNARKHLHKLIDPVWQSNKISRGKLYSKISKWLGYEYHTADIKDIKEARDIYKTINIHFSINGW